MNERPALDKHLDSRTFRSFYYLKEELVVFCRKNKLPVSGGKVEITDRIACFLDTAKVLTVSTKTKTVVDLGRISEDTKIEPNFVCTEKHRAFFKEKIGKNFSFNVIFQKWLKTKKTTIDSQFEYNTYIRDFFAYNNGKSLEEAIKCWKYKKGLQGHNRYEKLDLRALL